MNVRPTRRYRSDDGLLGLTTGALYLGLAFWLASQDLIFPDTLSRVANGYYVIFGRDPHLAAIGFVWNPLPSLSVIPLLLLSPLFPELAAKGLAGSIVSAICGAISMVLARRILHQLGVGRWLALALTAIFAVQPLMLLCSASGASEAMFMATSLYATLSLLRWLTEDEPWHLVHTGIALGLGYLVRYETAAAALSVTVLVLVFSFIRARAKKGPRAPLAVLDSVLVAAPFATAFFGWALTSRIVIGSWFATYVSEHGNTAQVAIGRESIDVVTQAWGGALSFASVQLLAIAPLAPVLVIVTAILAWINRDPRVLAPAAVLGSILVFDEVVFLTGSSFGWLRFHIMAIPWGILMAGYLIARLTKNEPLSTGRKVAVAALMVAVAAQTIPAWWASSHPELAREEARVMAFAAAGQYRIQAEIAEYIDSLKLPDGSIITDVTHSFPIVLASQNPRQFVITPDRDFATILEDPVRHGVRYALVTQPESSSADAVAARFPEIFATEPGVSSLSREWTDGRGATWRLYAFTGD